MIKIENKITLYLLSILFIFIPFTLIIGPFFPDLFLVVIILIFLSFSIIKKNFLVFKNNYLKFFLLFCLYLIIISVFTYNFLSIKSSLFYFRFGLFAFFSSYLIFYNTNIFKNLFYLLLFIYLSLFLDSIYQYFFSKNIFGFVHDYGKNFRITSFFNDDEVLGSYVARFFPLLTFLLIWNIKTEKSFNFIFLIFFITIASFITILLSGERTSIALFFLSFLFIFLSSKKFKKYFLVPFVAIVIGFLVLVFSSEKIKNRVITQTMNQMGFSSENERIFLFSKTYEGHYLIAHNMFMEKPIFGHGVKMFRVYCQKEENFVAHNACTTHPHNFYAQMLAETGLVGFITFITIFSYICYLFLKNLYFLIFRNKQLLTDEAICLLAFYFMTFFPLLPSGNFFNNWLSIIIYYPLGFLIFLINSKKFYA